MELFPKENEKGGIGGLREWALFKMECPTERSHRKTGTVTQNAVGVVINKFHVLTKGDNVSSAGRALDLRPERTL